MAGTTDFGKLVPGFDFLQGLLKNANASLPAIGQWIAPTLDPDELDKRINDLKTVQFWLEQNARMLSATVQALEVQRMTLSTLKTMNLPLADVRKSLEIKAPAAEAPQPAPPTPAPAAAKAPAAKTAAPAAGAVDPMQWWTALTQQFTELAANALKDADGAGAAAPSAGAAKSAAKAAPRKRAAAKKAAS